MKELIIMLVGCFSSGFGMSQCDIDFSYTNPLCNSECTGFVFASPSGTSPFNYDWSTGDTTQVLANLCEGTYTLTITDNLGCVHTDSISIVEPDTFIVDAYLISNASSSGFCDGEIGWSTQGGVPAFIIDWRDCISGQALWLPVPGFCPGDYYCVITDSNGCIDSSDCVTVGELSGFQELNYNELVCYPNPVFGELIVTTPEIQNSGYAIYEMSGRLILSGNIENSKIDLANLKSGQYVLKIISDTHEYSSLIVKE